MIVLGYTITLDLWQRVGPAGSTCALGLVSNDRKHLRVTQSSEQSFT